MYIKHWSAIVLEKKNKQGLLLNTNIFQQFSSVSYNCYKKKKIFKLIFPYN